MQYKTIFFFLICNNFSPSQHGMACCAFMHIDLYHLFQNINLSAEIPEKYMKIGSLDILSYLGYKSKIPLLCYISFHLLQCSACTHKCNQNNGTIVCKSKHAIKSVMYQTNCLSLEVFFVLFIFILYVFQTF